MDEGHSESVDLIKIAFVVDWVEGICVVVVEKGLQLKVDGLPLVAVLKGLKFST